MPNPAKVATIAVAQAMSLEFDFRRPLQTKDGRAARLLSIIDSAYPLVVAVTSLSSGKEAVVQYDVGGRSLTGYPGEELVNLEGDNSLQEHVNVGVWEFAPTPPDSNPFHYDAQSMGTPLVRGWTVMHEGFDREDDPRPLRFLYLHNGRTGQRFHIHLQPRGEQT